jgi:hypothetical protein
MLSWCTHSRRLRIDYAGVSGRGVTLGPTQRTSEPELRDV